MLSRSCTPGYLSQRNKHCCAYKTCTRMLTAALTTVAMEGKQPSCPSVTERSNTLGYIHVMEHCSEIKRSKLLIHSTAWRNLQRILSGWKKEKVNPESLHTLWFCLIAFLKWQNNRNGDQISCVLRFQLGGKEREVGVAMKGRCEGSPWWWKYSVLWLYPRNVCTGILCCNFTRQNYQRKPGKDARDFCYFLKPPVNPQVSQIRSFIADCVTNIIAPIYWQPRVSAQCQGRRCMGKRI